MLFVLTAATLCTQRAKPDMIAYSELRGEHTPTESHGHIPGVRVGQEFQGRGELAILGLHTQMMRGIMARWAAQLQRCYRYSILAVAYLPTSPPLAGGVATVYERPLHVLNVG